MQSLVSGLYVSQFKDFGKLFSRPARPPCAAILRCVDFGFLGGWNWKLCDKLTVKKPGFCGMIDCDPRRDQTCDVIDCRQSPRALDILEGGTGHVLRAFYFFFLLSAMGLPSKRITPFRQQIASCIR